MSGNSFGKLFTVTSFGKSRRHWLIVDGCPPGMELTEQDLQHDLTAANRVNRGIPPNGGRRMVRYSGVSMARRRAPDRFVDTEPDQRSGLCQDHGPVLSGHADYTYQQKYGFRDYRGGGRSSARNRDARSRRRHRQRYLRERCGVRIRGYLANSGRSCSISRTGTR
jgi:chorismate synthase